MKKSMGILIIVLALVIGIVPLFTDCLANGRSLTTADGRSVPMKCHWTAIAEIGMAVPLALVGIFTAFGKGFEGDRPGQRDAGQPRHGAVRRVGPARGENARHPQE